MNDSYTLDVKRVQALLGAMLVLDDLHSTTYIYSWNMIYTENNINSIIKKEKTWKRDLNLNLKLLNTNLETDEKNIEGILHSAVECSVDEFFVEKYWEAAKGNASGLWVWFFLTTLEQNNKQQVLKKK